MKWLALYVGIAIATFGLAASGESDCDTRAYDPNKCRAESALPAALGWPLYWSWVLAADLRK